jgi:hypothetical protein
MGDGPLSLADRRRLILDGCGTGLSFRRLQHIAIVLVETLQKWNRAMRETIVKA